MLSSLEFLVLPEVLLPCVLLCSVVCNVISSLFHIYVRKSLEEPCDARYHILRILVFCFQLNNILSALFICHVFFHLDSFIFPCLTIFLRGFIPPLQQACIFVITAATFWDQCFRGHYVKMFHNRLKKIFTFVVALMTLYVYFIVSMVCGVRPLFSEPVISLVKVFSFSQEDKKETRLALSEALSCYSTVFTLVGPTGGITMYALMACIVLRICFFSLTSWYGKLRPQVTPEEDVPMEEIVSLPHQPTEQIQLTRFKLRTIIITTLVTHSISIAPIILWRNEGFTNVFILFSTTLIQLIWMFSENDFRKYSFLLFKRPW